MQNHQDIIADLNKYTVKITTDNSVGTGIIVTPISKDTSTFEFKKNGLILTCYHVIGKAKYESETLFNDLKVYFQESKLTLSAQVIIEYCNPEYDIAFLQIKDAITDTELFKIAPLSEKVLVGHEFASIGFRKARDIEKLLTDGKIKLITNMKYNNVNNDKENPLVIQIESGEIDSGMSGAAVLDLENNRVVGIISHHYKSKNVNVDEGLNFAIPISSILNNSKAGLILKEKNPGLKPIYDFVRKIGEEGVLKYEKLPDLYVPPLNYKEIKETLDKNKIVFITGPPEYGKTYTAVHLLWEYFNQGYEPIWFKVGEIDPQHKRSDIRGEFSEIEKHLKPRHIIYYEDPFGKTEYEVKIDEGIERNIASIIETVERSKKDVYVIITSREEVFKEFKDIKIGQVDLKKYEKKLSIKNSYNYEKKKEMLLNHASIRGSKWQQDKVHANTVFEAIRKNERKLPTPLNIEQFALSTSSYEILDKHNLLQKIDEKSIETSSSFAQEINLMSKDKILFLTFPFISSSFSMDLVKYYYNKLTSSMFSEKEQARGFDKVVEWFKDDKVDIIPDRKGKNSIRFSHPSYYDALKNTLSSDKTDTKTRGILIKVLYELSDKKNLGSYYDALKNTLSSDKTDTKTRGILIKVLYERSDKKNLGYDVFSSVTRVVSRNFDKLPEHVRNELLLKLADNKDVVSSVAIAVVLNFDKLPEKIQNLLFKMADNKDAAEDVASTVAHNFDKLPEKVQNLLFKMADNKYFSSVARGVDYFFDDLPEHVRNELLLKLADNKYVVSSVARAVALNFSWSYLWDKFLNVKEITYIVDSAYEVASTVDHNFDKLPEHVRNELLLKVSDYKDAAREVANAVAVNYDKLPEHVRKKFKKQFNSTTQIVSK